MRNYPLFSVAVTAGVCRYWTMDRSLQRKLGKTNYQVTISLSPNILTITIIIIYTIIITITMNILSINSINTITIIITILKHHHH